MVIGDITTGTEVLVIGAGPAGYVAAIRAGQLDLDVTLVEKEAYGGTCLNYGCIPSKALISATDVADRARNAEEMGIHADPAVDLAGMMGWKDNVVSQLTGGVEKLCKANGVNLFKGEATFTSENTARISHGGDGQDSETVEFEHTVVATGSRPIELPNFAFADESVFSSRQALSLETVPDSLVVVGAGYIGMELSTVFAKLGTDVTVVELLEEVLPGWGEELTRPVRKRANELGIDFHFGYTADEWYEHGEGIRVVAKSADTTADGAQSDDATTDTAGNEETLELAADHVLVAIGREPVSDTLALDAAGVETDDRGFVPTDDRARTNVDHVFAIGDVAGEPMLAHKGSMEGQVAVEVIAGEPSAIDAQTIPAVVFTEPEIAAVGMSESEAEEANFDVDIGEFPFQASGRALTTGHSDGFVRIVADADAGFVLGGQVVGPEASELIAELGLAVEIGATLEDVASTIHAHPTLSEATMEAAENTLGHAIHTQNR